MEKLLTFWKILVWIWKGDFTVISTLDVFNRDIVAIRFQSLLFFLEERTQILWSSQKRGNEWPDKNSGRHQTAAMESSRTRIDQRCPKGKVIFSRKKLRHWNGFFKFFVVAQSNRCRFSSINCRSRDVFWGRNYLDCLPIGFFRNDTKLHRDL